MTSALQKNLQKVVIYTDGASRGNPGPGGYGAVLLFEDASGELHTKELSCGYKQTTNNRMELMAVIVALETLKRPCSVEIHSDSKYVVSAFEEGWIESWQARGWKTADKKPVKNLQLWQRLLVALEPHELHWFWVKGHAGDTYNERADELACQGADGLSGELLEDDFGD